MKALLRAVNEGRYALYFVGACVVAIIVLSQICSTQGNL